MKIGYALTSVSGFPSINSPQVVVLHALVAGLVDDMSRTPSGGLSNRSPIPGME